MREGKGKKQHDRISGQEIRRGRGLVVSPAMEIEGRSLNLKSVSLDPQELRFALLFWDKLVWPRTRPAGIPSGPTEEFLEQEKILFRPEIRFSGDFAQGLAKSQILTFLELEKRDPGAWALAQGENSLLLKDDFIEEGRGELVTLHRAIPVPDKEVPLEDILRFREKRWDELVGLRLQIDEFFSAISTAEDVDFELRHYIEKVDEGCADVLKVSRESKFPLRLLDLNSFFNIELDLVKGVIAAALGLQFGLSLTEAAIAAAVFQTKFNASISITKSFGARGIDRSNPYRYVAEFHEELF